MNGFFFYRNMATAARSVLQIMGFCLLIGTTVCAQETKSVAERPTISLSPSVVMLKGQPGQSSEQTLRLTNRTPILMSFEMVAEDVVIKDGKRVFVPAGETPQSIAATAVFSQNEVQVPPGQTAEVNVTLTVPPETRVRAVVVIFHGKDLIAVTTKARATASLGTLFTFNLSKDVRVDPGPVEITPQTPTANAAVIQSFTNTGKEPVVMKGVAVVLNQFREPVAKLTFNGRRLLPGEQQEFKSDVPVELKPGRYQVYASFLCAGKAITNSAGFVID